MNIRDAFIDQKMRELSNIKEMCDKTSGEMRQMWQNKWYQLVKIISTRIEQLKELNSDK